MIIIIFNENEINNSIQNLIHYIKDQHDLCFSSEINKNQKRVNKPWINENILHLLKERNKVLKLTKRTPSLSNTKFLKLLNDQLKKDIKEAKHNYLKLFLQENRNNHKRYWYKIKNLMGYKSKRKYVNEMKSSYN